MRCNNLSATEPEAFHLEVRHRKDTLVWTTWNRDVPIRVTATPPCNRVARANRISLWQNLWHRPVLRMPLSPVRDKTPLTKQAVMPMIKRGYGRHPWEHTPDNRVTMKETKASHGWWWLLLLCWGGKGSKASTKLYLSLALPRWCLLVHFKAVSKMHKLTSDEFQLLTNESKIKNSVETNHFAAPLVNVTTHTWVHTSAHFVLCCSSWAAKRPPQKYHHAPTQPPAVSTTSA